MQAETIWGLIGVFAGGAVPWLEALIVIPAGIVAGLPVVPVIVAGSVGNLLTVGLSAYGGDWLGRWWSNAHHRRQTRKGVDPETLERKRLKRQRRRDRIARVMDRGGLPLLAFLGPLLGTQFCAVAAVALGARAFATVFWIGLFTILWCVAAAWATIAGVELIGIGG